MNNLNKPRVVFFGTDDISSTVLQTLIDLDTNIVGVVTRADKVSGRQKQIVFSEVKTLALKNNLVLLQPVNLKEEMNKILELKPDLILTCSYGKIIPEQIIDYPIYHAVNIHPSLLPKYRGASPIQTTIWNNDKQGGVSFLYMTKGLDEGDIIFQQAFDIHQNWTAVDLRNKVKEVIAEMLKQNFTKLYTSNHLGIKQDPNLVSFSSLIKREDEFIDWTKSANFIYGQIKALYDKPIASTIYNDLFIKVHKATLLDVDATSYKPGQIIEINKNGILVATSDKIINLQKIQLPGKKANEVSQLINGKLPFSLNSCFKNYK